MTTGRIPSIEGGIQPTIVDANSDFAEVKVVDMSLTDASDNVRMAMRFRTGVQVGILTDCVI